jgi:4-diphosphocytidyl-2-C-methyl-D-erythritol kinase
MALSARAPAKLNLCLFVGPRRSDGLHEICSLFQSVTLADEVTLSPAPGGSDEIVCPQVSGPNLAGEALAAFRGRFGWDAPPQRVTIEKRIPIAAGLGGGSADAAAVLRLAGTASRIFPPADELRSLAMSLGADVPFQLEPGTAVVRGAGEEVEPVARPGELALLVLVPNDGLSTREVYSRADALGLPKRDLEQVAAQLLALLTDGADIPDALAKVVQNDLQPAAIELEPSAGRALELLRESGARGAAISGSGPAAFGLYRSASEAKEARPAVAPSWDGKTIVVGAVGADYGAPRPASITSWGLSGSGQ